MKQFLKEGSLLALCFLVILALLAITCPAQQTLDNPSATIVLTGERASVTLKDVSASRAITELVDISVKARQTSIVVTDGSGEAAWSIEYDPDSKLYSARNYDDLLGGEQFTNLADAKKVLKIAMKSHYSEYNELCFVDE